MTRFHCVLQRHDFSTIMNARIPALTLSGISVRPQPGDELEITIASPDRSTDTVMTDILTARINADRSAFIVAVRPRRAISEPEPLTPVGKIMQEYHEKQARKHNTELARTLAAVNRKAAIARYVHSTTNRQSRR
ncbi:TPA: hypothetical protein KFO73_003762 [Escherichia coli]|uniref:hypothetical protein n=1 Tax=Escherichia coli TaxID=562 RepID=UPI000BE4F0BE|nr:hypothetical protein [Escherichia coli]EFC5374459.1 hypothetical protein [Escherichia coli]EGO4138952.1 hypothetical protein [Escherichia coli]EHL6434487.1 hypothetical protein [Escherichia coli]EJD9549584.1 hypothetical protein [Escherichia coli]EJD9573758.1 hypothetical protein [Escherichia coli]